MSVRNVFIVAALVLHLAAIYLTFSRSAWAGALLVIGLTFWWNFSSQLVRFSKKWWPVIGVLLVLIGGIFYWQRNNSTIDGVITHSTATQRGAYDSNEFHWMYVRDGVVGIWREPLGHGPGTAGLVSIRDPGGGHLTENYYIQVGYEVGVSGLLLFVLLNIWVYVRIWRSKSPWAPMLLVSFWAYLFINMLLHIWSNEAVAAQWWLLAGIAIAGSGARVTANTDV